MYLYRLPMKDKKWQRTTYFLKRSNLLIADVDEYLDNISKTAFNLFCTLDIWFEGSFNTIYGDCVLL